ncbi:MULTISPECIES: ABC transporter permease [Halolamina]|uniref:ABC-2 type transport system permease protein n=1 Tax=Halolamina pelagica TaxID=699431 RepID=A0A1I5W1V2_9EURY|nr:MULTISPECIES: ABC transporter permease [Halolamina]SFQ13722.1 ABC-2 type transport system permease protein [Halolamina pelagica]
MTAAAGDDRREGDGPGDAGGPSQFTDPERTGGYAHLLKAVVYRDLLIWVRYPLNAALGIFMGVFFFALMFYGGTMVAGQAFSDSIEGLIIGYFLWTLAIGAYSGIMNDIQSEASWGTLERHFMTPFGFGPVVVAKSIAIVFRTFMTSAVVLVVMLLITGTTLDLNLVTVLPVATLTIAGALGLGLVMGGLSVLYKRISNVANLLQFAFIGLISAPVFDIPWARFLPLAQGSAMLQRAMRDGVRLWEFDPLTITVLVGTSVGYLALGYAIFGLTTRRARRLGVLGDY